VPDKNTQPDRESCLIVGAHGRHYVVETPDRTHLHCYPRGKKTQFACGDKVTIERTGDRQGTIVKAEPRTSLLYRSDRYRQKIIAANVTQAVVVIAAKPAFHDDLLLRCLLACEQQGIKGLIALNKTDLIAESEALAQQLELYESLGYEVVPVSAKQDISPVIPALQGHLSVLVGQSGMGKSTIVNALVPDAQARTAEFSVTEKQSKLREAVNQFCLRQMMQAKGLHSG
jgi:ribosome biogenesis GTPase